MKQNIVKFLLSLTCVVGIVLAFQNCAKSQASLEEQMLSQNASIFEYRYERATPIYFEFHLVPTTSDATYQNYDLIGFAALSDGTLAPVNYEIEVLDANKDFICPVRSGILASGSTRIVETCAKRKTAVIKSAIFRVRTPDGEWHEYVKNY